jgi:hypothetical protein
MKILAASAKGHGAEHFSRPRRMALTLLRREQKLELANKLLMAGWDHHPPLKIPAT